jgi:hypothetical protein
MSQRRWEGFREGRELRHAPFPKAEAGVALNASVAMAFTGIATTPAQIEDMAVSLAVLILSDGEKEISVSSSPVPVPQPLASDPPRR